LRGVDLAIVGAGPAGLAAAIEGAKRGCSTVVVDRNPKPGGQLIKQIHKFFGSREHRAGTRGVDIAQDLFREVHELGTTLMLGWEVYAIQPGRLEVVQSSFGESPDEQPEASIHAAKKMTSIVAKKIVLATGAEENAIHFDGWTLPGVMGAGAAQTMINVWRVLPGHRILMVGSGNVGLIVTYQLLQAGADVLAVVEAAPQIGGYRVHAATRGDQSLVARKESMSTRSVWQ
jgi:NADPH-dependent 2,4-dienoyl-CoA reductase/sulfur reductase-like enzyme